jgi:nitroreductase
MDAAPLLQALHWRYAVKLFDGERTIPAATWAALEEALVLSPSSYGLQPWKFLVITDPALRSELRPYSWNQSSALRTMTGFLAWSTLPTCPAWSAPAVTATERIATPP